MKYINSNVLDFTFELSPYTHIVLDNFIKEEYLDSILQDLEELTIDKTYFYGGPLDSKNKYAFNSHFSPLLEDIFKELNSDEFINLLEHKTGINNIIRNNLSLEGAGVHKVFNEGFLKMHTDFEAYIDNTHGILDRRLNLLLYMNKDWKEEYGGELCLYDRIKNKITKKIMPILNRCVIFVTPGNLHGHPNPLKLPENKARQAITTYYYTKNVTGYNLYGTGFRGVEWYHNIM